MNISILEDNAVVCELLTTALSLHGHRVVTYTTAFAFLEAFAQAHTMRSDVLLVDEMLPGGISGSAAVHQLQRLWPNDLPPIIFITGAGRLKIEQIEEAFPTMPVLTKPLHMKMLLQTIEKRKSIS